MPEPLPLPPDVRRVDERWLRDCPKCGEVVSHLRRNYAVHSSLSSQPCKRCSNIDNHRAGMVGKVRVAWYNSFQKSALLRGLEWELTIEFVDALYELQEGRCAFSGLPIQWSEVNWNHSASIDRIDNERGYLPDNVQLVHKEINMMRGSLSPERFVELCALVSDLKSGVESGR